MLSRFEYRPLVLALLALQAAPSLAQEAAASAPEATTPLAPAPAAAESAAVEELDEVVVKAQAESAYKADTVSSPKFTQALVDTPQTITVIKKEILQEQGAVSLMEALRNTPGITMQLGENGNTSAGDTFQLRGFSTQSSTFVDGIRDLGAVTRDTFNLDAVEVAKGPAGADIGRGASSGYINLVSKLPGLESAASGSLGVNTAGHQRLTADLNQKVGTSSAVRLNVMEQAGGIDGRNEVENNGWAVAPAFATGLGTDKRTYVYFQHVQQSNVPDGGIPTIGMEGFYNTDAALDAGAAVSPENFYGSVNDYEDVTADMLTLKTENDLDARTTLSNISRYGQTKMERVLTGVNTGSTGLSVNGQPGNPAAWTVNRSRQRVDQENRILGNITNLATTFDTGSAKHALASGVELMYEEQQTLSFSTTGLTIPNASLYNPDPDVSLPLPYASGASSNGSTLTTAAYLFDTVEITPAWQLTAGLRYEHFKTTTTGKTVVTATNAAQYPGYSVGQLAPDALNNSDNLLSWKLGALYKPARNGSIYVAYATSQTPPGGANFTLNSSTTNASNPNLDPQEANNIEAGTKWDVLSNRLSLTAAIYRTENINELSSYDAISNSYAQYGKRQVQGVELGAVGNVTELWQVSTGIATMDTEIKEGSTGNNAAGAATRWSPDLTATLWTTYKLSDALTIGGGARYVSEQKRVIDPAASVATSPMPEIPAYWVVDAMASYKLLQKLTLRGNIYNLLDEEYISTLNNGGGRMTRGAPLSAALSLDFQF